MKSFTITAELGKKYIIDESTEDEIVLSVHIPLSKKNH